MVDPYDDFQEDTLIQKKALILSIVKKLCTKRNLPLPHVNFEYCADEHENQLAHYHPGENIICFSKRQLIIQSFEDLRETTAHEVAHILVPEHTPQFLDQEEVNLGASWRPPGAVSVVTEGQSSPEKPKDGRSNRPIKYKCNYHLCGKKVPTKKCKFCEKYFCKEHKNPFEPYVGSIEEHGEDKNGHPFAVGGHI